MPNKEKPPTPFSVETARAIKSRIERLGVSNAAVARKSGLSANYLNERLREEKSFTLSDIERLADYFGVTPGALMREVPTPNVGGGEDDDYSFTAEGPGKSALALAAKKGTRKIDE